MTYFAFELARSLPARPWDLQQQDCLWMAESGNLEAPTINQGCSTRMGCGWTLRCNFARSIRDLGPQRMSKAKEMDSWVLGKVLGTGSVTVPIRSHVGLGTLSRHWECAGVLSQIHLPLRRDRSVQKVGSWRGPWVCPRGCDAFTLTHLSPVEHQTPLLTVQVVV